MLLGINNDLYNILPQLNNIGNIMLFRMAVLEVVFVFWVFRNGFGEVS